MRLSALRDAGTTYLTVTDRVSSTISDEPWIRLLYFAGEDGHTVSDLVHGRVITQQQNGTTVTTFEIGRIGVINAYERGRRRAAEDFVVTTLLDGCDTGFIHVVGSAGVGDNPLGPSHRTNHDVNGLTNTVPVIH